jgi:hypothetical protein
MGGTSLHSTPYTPAAYLTPLQTSFHLLPSQFSPTPPFLPGSGSPCAPSSSSASSSFPSDGRNRWSCGNGRRISEFAEFFILCFLSSSPQAIQSYSVISKLPRPLANLLPFSSSHGPISLSTHSLSATSFSSPRSSRRRRDLESGADDYSDDDASSTHSNEDELPGPSPSLGGIGRKSYSFAPPSSTQKIGSAAEQVQKGVGNVLETLGWKGEWMRSNGNGMKAFWGMKKQDRGSGIRLAHGGYESGRETSAPPPVPPKSTHGRSQSTSSEASATALFDLGEDAEGGDAVELPAQFSLSSSSSPSSGGNSRQA